MKEIPPVGGHEVTHAEKLIERRPSARSRTDDGLLVPPGIAKWNDFFDANPEIEFSEEEKRERYRWGADHNERFILLKDPEAQREQNELRRRFFDETRICVSEIRRYLEEKGVEVMINPRSSKGLSARQRGLPKVKVLLLPLFFGSNEDKQGRMQGVQGVAECLLHFSEEGDLQTTRFHRKVGYKTYLVSAAIAEAIETNRERLQEAYKRQDFIAVGDIIGAAIEYALSP